MNEDIKKFYNEPHFTQSSKNKSYGNTFGNSDVIPLEDEIYVGEHRDWTQPTKQGNYKVMRIARDGFDETALLYVHEDDWVNKYNEDINDIINDIHVVTILPVDGGSYGISYGDIDDGQPYAAQQDVHGTNYGDGDFVLYTNNENSVFLMDDEDIVMGILNEKFFEMTGIDEDKYEISIGYKPNNIDISIWNFETKEEKQFPIVPKHGETDIQATVRTAFEMVDSENLAKDNSLSKALSDLQREAIAEEMSNLY